MNTKRCLILGANSDVAQSTAYLFAEKGYNLQLASRNIGDYQDKLKNDLMIRHKVEVQLLEFDGAKYDTHEHFCKNLTPFPDVVVSVFGYLGEQEKAMTNFQECYNIMNANYMGHVSVLNLIANEMKGNKKGSIIGVSSVAGERGRQSNFIYGSAKAAFTTYLSGLRNSLFHHGIHVATVMPGFINTKMIKGIKTPKPLTANPHQVAKAIWVAYSKKKNIVYVLFMWRYIMLIIKNIPEFIFKKMKM